MLPIYEIVFGKLKKIPIINKSKNIPIIRSVKDKIRSNYMDTRRKLVQVNGYEIITDMMAVSEEIGIPIWVDWGTLLGLYRDGKIIEHDYDLDVSTWRLDDTMYEKFKSILFLNGYTLVREFNFNNNIVTQTYEKKGVLVDVDYYFGNKEHAWTYSFNISSKSDVKEKRGIQYINGMDVFVFHTDNLVFSKKCFNNGISCLAPKDIERRIIEEYGEDWKTPIKAHDWTKQNNFEYLGFSIDMVGWRAK